MPIETRQMVALEIIADEAGLIAETLEQIRQQLTQLNAQAGNIARKGS